MEKLCSAFLKCRRRRISPEYVTETLLPKKMYIKKHFEFRTITSMKTCWTCLFCLLAFSAFSQVDFTGSWKGVLTQNPGGYRSNYQFELYLIQKGDRISGRTYVAVDDINAVLEIEGEVVGEEMIRFEEVRFIKFSELQDMEWCYKSALLKLKRSQEGWRLEGPWAGKTSFGPCIPGKIFVQRQKPQA